MGVCSQKSFHCVHKANESPGFKTCCGGLWTCALGAGGPICEVFCIPHAFTCTGSACFADTVIDAGAEGVVVLKGVAISGTVGVILESYWHCIAFHLFHLLFSIWNTFDVPLGVPFTVLTSDILLDVPFGVLLPVLPPFILLKCGTLSPFTTISCG